MGVGPLSSGQMMGGGAKVLSRRKRGDNMGRGGKVSWSSEEEKEGKNSETWADDQLLGEKDNPGSCSTVVAHFSGKKIHQILK